jgi:hypothetical protein
VCQYIVLELIIDNRRQEILGEGAVVRKAASRPISFPYDRRVGTRVLRRVLLLRSSSPPSLLKRRAAVAELSPEFPVSAPPRQKARGAQRERNNLTALFEFTFRPRTPRARICAITFARQGGEGSRGSCHYPRS